MFRICLENNATRQHREPKMEGQINLISEIVNEKLKSSFAEHKNSLIHDIERIVENSNFEDCIWRTIIKNKSNEEQFKHNAQVNFALDKVEHLLENRNFEETRHKVAEGQFLTKMYILLTRKKFSILYCVVFITYFYV